MSRSRFALLGRLSLAITLGCGLIGLIWGLSHLQSIFLEERDETLRGIAQRKDAVEQFAKKELEQELSRQLDRAARSIHEAIGDPLLPANHLLSIDDGEQRLPRLALPHRGTGTPAKALYQELLTRYQSAPSTVPAGDGSEARSDSPRAVRLLLFERCAAAIRARDRALIERSVRALLGHRAQYVLPEAEDLPVLLALLDLLSNHSTPAPQLMRGLLREGLPYGGTPASPRATMGGIQRQLLRQRARLSAADFQFLKKRVTAISERTSVLWTDFADRASEPQGPVVSVEPDLSEPALLESGRWYVAPRGGGQIRGVAVDVTELVAEIASGMKERGLLEADDRVEATVAPTQPLSGLTLIAHSPSWERARSRADGRHQLKTALGVASGVLSLGILVLGWMVYRRRHRFVELKSSFVSAVSHELRTPLASIRLMAETLERRTRKLPEARDYPTRIIRDIDGLSLLIENILSFDRLSSGRWKAKLAKVKLADVIGKIEAELHGLSQRSVDLRQSGLDEAEIVADADLLHLLLANLVKNACNYNKRDPVEITIAAQPRAGGGLTLTVTDNGVGIPPGEEDRIFGDFYRASTRTDQAVRGSGLGLAICRKIMEAHKGRIRVAKTSEQGTTFELTVPKLQAKQDATAPSVA